MNIDSIYVISVKEAHERRKNMLNWWNHPRIKLQFNIVEKNKKNPEEGCFRSHENIINNVKKTGLNRILILEDDAKPTTNLNNIINKVNDSLEWLDNNKPDWTYLMLGYFPIRSKKTNNKNIFNLKCAFLSHAYIVNVKNVTTPDWNKSNDSGIDGLLFCNNKIPINIFSEIKKIKSNVYGLNPMIVKQYGIDSYISYTHSSIQEHFLHVIGQDNLAKLSCHTNVAYFSFLIVSLLILLLIGIPLIFINHKNKNLCIFFIFLFLLIIIPLTILSSI